MDGFSAKVLAWYRHHGRHDLPWQVADPYARWLAEVMLQQTTVTAVVPYYERFMRRFPSVQALAQASLDDVLALWSGLGYYARARNLHAAARLLMDRHSGVFPRTADEWAALPGIGPSTAAAIVAFAFNIPAAILDANVRRVLSRYHGVRGRDAPTERLLWSHARTHTPTRRVADYTQAIMDLGALVCRKTPDCPACPLADDCAFDGEEVPFRRPAKPERTVYMAVIAAPDQGILLVRRPPRGIWGGLWSLPESAALAALPAAIRDLGFEGEMGDPYPPIWHVFTHFRLSINPVRVLGASRRAAVAEGCDAMWYKGALPGPGMPAPVRRLINQFLETS
ncbi:MAG: A/G-specific adenine glycosylase [Acidiferrobacter sp.]